MSIIPHIEQRPWGQFLEFTRNTPSTVKIIEIKKGEALSKQLHHLREEFWYIISGEGRALIGEQTKNISTGAYYFIPKNTEHRIEASEDVVILEIALGEADESDIVRLEDKYGRVDITAESNE
jgi:mannose-6-phosphate isomerase-like protein (cupin superfamily)